MADDLVHEPEHEPRPTVPESPAATPDGPQPQATATDPTYHILLWPEPPGTPPTYLCLLCPSAAMTEAAVHAHVTEVHAVAPVPTPTAASPPVLEEVTGLLVMPRAEGPADG